MDEKKLREIAEQVAEKRKTDPEFEEKYQEIGKLLYPQDSVNRKERRELDALREKKHRTAEENKRYEELLRKLFEKTLYHGGNEED